MNYEEFCQNLQEYLQNHIVGAEILLKKVLKTNGIELISLNIVQEGENFSPNIYLGPVYDFYRQRHLSIEQVAQCVMDLHMDMMNDLKECGVPAFEFEDFEQIRERLTIRLVNRELNREMLEDSISIPFLDLEGIFYIAEDIRSMETVLRVPEGLVESWGVDLEEMKELALKNLLEQGAFQLRDICDVISREARERIASGQERKPKMYVLTDISGVNGPSALLLPSLLKRFADELDDDLLLLPSSVNELVVVRNTGSDKNDLKRIVKEINDSMVFPEDILGDTIYQFSREQSEVTVAA